MGDERGPVRLRAWRHHRALSIRELAAAAGVTVRTVQKWEASDPPHNPHPRTLRKFAAALRIEPHELYQQPGQETTR